MKISEIIEARDPHKIISDKLKDIERAKNPPSADEQDPEKRSRQAKDDYRKYVEKMKKKNPNFIPMFKMD